MRFFLIATRLNLPLGTVILFIFYDAITAKIKYKPGTKQQQSDTRY